MDNSSTRDIVLTTAQRRSLMRAVTMQYSESRKGSSISQQTSTPSRLSPSQFRVISTNTSALASLAVNPTGKLPVLPRNNADRNSTFNGGNRCEPERKVVYSEKQGQEVVRHILDFDSPRTKEAAAQLGITFEDCVKKYQFSLLCRIEEALCSSSLTCHRKSRN